MSANSGNLRFDGRVVIVTGGAGALGRAYCTLFASRGASVVVNDLPAKAGSGSESNAEKLVASLRAQGYKAIANHDSVTDGDRIVKAAIDTFGRVDVIINNAGILADTSFVKMSPAQWENVMKVHLDGAYRVSKAAWPYMIKQKYGRIINTSSAAGLYGNFGQANYATAKLALVGLTFTLAKEGARSNIHVNAIAPIAGSPMTETILPADLVQALKPEYVAPLVAYLSHDDCKETGKVFEVGGGWVSELRWQRSKGEVFPLTSSFTPEAVAASWSTISSFDAGSEYPTDPQAAFSVILENLEKAKAAQEAEAQAAAIRAKTQQQQQQQQQQQAGETKSSSSTTSSVGQSPEDIEQAALEQDFESARVFRLLKEFISKDLVKKVKGIFAFEITNAAGKKARWVVDLKNGDGRLYVGSASQGIKADATLILTDEVFVSVVKKEAQPVVRVVVYRAVGTVLLCMCLLLLLLLLSCVCVFESYFPLHIFLSFFTLPPHPSHPPHAATLHDWPTQSQGQPCPGNEVRDGHQATRGRGACEAINCTVD